MELGAIEGIDKAHVGAVRLIGVDRQATERAVQGGQRVSHFLSRDEYGLSMGSRQPF